MVIFALILVDEIEGWNLPMQSLYVQCTTVQCDNCWYKLSLLLTADDSSYAGEVRGE